MLIASCLSEYNVKDNVKFMTYIYTSMEHTLNIICIKSYWMKLKNDFVRYVTKGSSGLTLIPLFSIGKYKFTIRYF